MIQDPRTCPRCRRGAMSVLTNRYDYRILECIYCMFSWKRYPEDGSWELVVNRNDKTLEYGVTSALYVWEEAAL